MPTIPELKKLRDEFFSLRDRLEAALKALDPAERQAAGLPALYMIIAYDPLSPPGGKPIFGPFTTDMEKARAQIGAHHARNHNQDYRAEMRGVLRAQKMPEPMIWERWPARTPEEREDQKIREDRWYTQQSRIAYKKESLENRFLEKYAKKSSPLWGRPAKDLLEDPEFLQQARKEFQVAQELAKELGL
jgi:hypothetical protein